MEIMLKPERRKSMMQICLQEVALGHNEIKLKTEYTRSIAEKYAPQSKTDETIRGLSQRKVSPSSSSLI